MNVITTFDAYLFFVLGTVMRFLPAWFPGHFPPTGLDGANGSALWLQLIGWVNNAIGAGFIVQLQVNPLLHWLLYWAQVSWEELAQAEIFRPALRLELQLQFSDGTGHRDFL